MKKYNVDIEKLKARFAKQTIKYVKMAELRADILEERHVKISLPLKDIHVNHIGGAYAGSTFVLCEVAGGYAIFSAFGDESYVPIVSKMTIEYLKPTKNECYVEISFTKEEAEALIKPIEERGKGRLPFTFYVEDTEGNRIAKMDAVYYLLPKESK